MKVNEVKVKAVASSKKGVRIAIPAAIRDTLEIKAGQELLMESHVEENKKYAIIKKQE